MQRRKPIPRGLTWLGQAVDSAWSKALEMQSGPAPTPLDFYRRRVQLRHALVTVEAAIALREERTPAESEPAPVDLERLREDLLVALWLTEVLLSRH
jgi:hypothetical protein